MTRFAALRRPENEGLRNLLAAAVAAMLIIGGLSLSLVQSHQAEAHAKKDAASSHESAEDAALSAKQSNEALMVANQAIDCLNQVLAERATTTVKDNRAAINLAKATSEEAVSFEVLLKDILFSSPDSKSTPDFLAYVKVHENLIKVSTATSDTLAADQDYRDKHPLGHC